MTDATRVQYGVKLAGSLNNVEIYALHWHSSPSRNFAQAHKKPRNPFTSPPADVVVRFFFLLVSPIPLAGPRTGDTRGCWLFLIRRSVLLKRKVRETNKYA